MLSLLTSQWNRCGSPPELTDSIKSSWSHALKSFISNNQNQVLVEETHLSLCLLGSPSMSLHMLPIGSRNTTQQNRAMVEGFWAERDTENRSFWSATFSAPVSTMGVLSQSPAALMLMHSDWDPSHSANNTVGQLIFQSSFSLVIQRSFLIFQISHHESQGTGLGSLGPFHCSWQSGFSEWSRLGLIEPSDT